MTAEQSTARPPSARPLGRRRTASAGLACGVLAVLAGYAVPRLSGPPLCEDTDSGFGCIGTFAGLSTGALVALLVGWALLWRWAAAARPWAVAARGLLLTVAGLALGIAAHASADRPLLSLNRAVDDRLRAVTLLAWLGCIAAAATAGAALWLAGRRRRALLVLPALLVALVGASALAAVGTFGYQAARIRMIAGQPYGLVDPELTLAALGTEDGVVSLSYQDAAGRGIEVTVADRPPSADLTAACSPAVVTALGERLRACAATAVAVPAGLAWTTLPTDQDVAVVVVEPDAVVLLQSTELEAGTDELLARLPALRRLAATTLLRSTEQEIRVR